MMQDVPPSATQGIRKMRITDIGARRQEFFFEPPWPLRRLLASMIKDPRDEPILFMLFNVLCLTIPAALCVFRFFPASHAIGFAYWLCNTLLFQERFILGLHFYAHRGLFRSKLFDTVFAWFMSPFFGLPSCMYHLHHVVMHHAENNLDGWDLSSTERFQRDNFLHLLCYWLRFLCLVWVELPVYACRRGRYALAAGTVAGICIFMGRIFAMYMSRPVATFWVFIFPTFANSFLLMFGNWSQHMFVDPAKPRCNYHLAFNAINDSCNQRTFNDGYHIEHHANSRRHWTELPHSFLDNLDRYAAEDAIVFQGINPLSVGVMVFLRRYDVLARHLVQLKKDGGKRMDAEAVEKFLRARLVPITAKR